MASTILVDKIDPQSGTSLEIGSSGDTINIPSGATLNVAGSTSGIAQGITNAEQHQQTSTVSITSADTWTLLTPFARSSGGGLGNIETYVSSSSGIFSFSQTGYYSIEFVGYLKRVNNLIQYAGTSIWMTTNNSSFTELVESYTNLQDTGNAYGNTSNKVIVDITDTSQCKVKFMAQASDASGSLDVQAGSGLPMKNYATFVRIGDT